MTIIIGYLFAFVAFLSLVYFLILLLNPYFNKKNVGTNAPVRLGATPSLIVIAQIITLVCLVGVVLSLVLKPKDWGALMFFLLAWSLFFGFFSRYLQKIFIILEIEKIVFIEDKKRVEIPYKEIDFSKISNGQISLKLKDGKSFSRPTYFEGLNLILNKFSKDKKIVNEEKLSPSDQKSVSFKIIKSYFSFLSCYKQEFPMLFVKGILLPFLFFWGLENWKTGGSQNNFGIFVAKWSKYLMPLFLFSLFIAGTWSSFKKNNSKFFKLVFFLLVLNCPMYAEQNFVFSQFSDGQYVYLRARYYDPETGTFLTKDPIGIQGGINTYQYALANPINYTDPKGLVFMRRVAASLRETRF